MKLLNVLAALVLAVAIAMLAAVARAQTYDPENKWIGRSIRQQLHSEHDHHEPRRRNLSVEYRDRWRDSKPRHYYAPPPRHVHKEPESHPSTRVHGALIRRWDATGSVECYPHVEAYSVEANTEDGAWRDAQRNWESQTRAMYGERFMEIQNASGATKQCWVSSGNQSVAGRAMERIGNVVQSVTGNEGGVDGRKHRCRVLAKPCQAPVETDPPLKGDKQ